MEGGDTEFETSLKGTIWRLVIDVHAFSSTGVRIPEHTDRTETQLSSSSVTCEGDEWATEPSLHQTQSRDDDARQNALQDKPPVTHSAKCRQRPHHRRYACRHKRRRDSKARDMTNDKIHATVANPSSETTQSVSSVAAKGVSEAPLSVNLDSDTTCSSAENLKVPRAPDSQMRNLTSRLTEHDNSADANTLGALALRSWSPKLFLSDMMTKINTLKPTDWMSNSPVLERSCAQVW